MHTTFSSPHEDRQHATAIQDAHRLIIDQVKAAADSGRLQTLALDQKAFVCELVLGPLATPVTEGLVTLPMIERWTMEAISHQAKVGAKPLLTARDLYQLSVRAGDPSENRWTWSTLPEEVQDFYECLADLVHEALSLCSSCGERKPDALHEVAGLRLCSLCISAPQEGNA